MAPRKCSMSPVRPTPKSIPLYPGEEEEEELLQEVLQILENTLKEEFAARTFPTPPPTPDVTEDDFRQELKSPEVSSMRPRSKGTYKKYRPLWCFKCHGFGHIFNDCPITFWRIPFCKTCGLWSYELLESSCSNLDDPRHCRKRNRQKVSRMVKK